MKKEQIPISYLVVLICGISLLIISIAYFYYSSEKQAFRKNQQQEIKAIAGLKIDQILQWRKDKMAQIKLFSQSVYFSEAIVLWLNHTESHLLKKEVEKRLKNVAARSEFGYSNILLVSANKELLLSLNTKEDTLNPLIYEKITEAFKKNQIILTDFYYCSIHNKIHYDVIAPVVDKNDNPIAVLVFRINPDDFLYPLIKSWPTPSKTAETIIVRKEDDSVLYLNELQKQNNSKLNYRVSLSRKELPAVRAVLGFNGIYEGTDYRGVEVLSYLESVPGTPWILETKIDKSEVYAELQYRAIFLIILTSVLILLAAVSLILVYNSRQKNIYQKLLASENELSSNQLKHNTTLYSISEGVISTDINGKIKQMNPMAEKLTGWVENVAIGKPLENIFRIINEESRKTASNPVKNVLMKGKVEELVTQTILISKNGTEIPIASSTAPIKSTTGEITGVVLVFRDQTREQQATIALKQSEATIRNKLKAITEPEGDIGALELSDIIDTEELQSILEDFYRLTGMLGAVLDLKGKVIVAVGWQDICIKFHRCNPNSLKNCIESDTILTNGVPEGEFKIYKCKNNMWDMVTPLFVGGKQIGNIFIGQFFQADEKPDLDLFRKQARKFGFNETEYIAALNRVPRFSKESIETGMQFYAKLTGIISRLSFSTIQQSRLLAERKLAEDALKESEAKFRNLFEHSTVGMSMTGMDGYLNANQSFCDMLGYSQEELRLIKWQEITHPDDIQLSMQNLKPLEEGKTKSTRFEKRYLHKNGTIVWTDASTYIYQDEKGEPQFFISAFSNITKRKLTEKEVQEAQAETKRLLEVAEKSRKSLLSILEDEKRARLEIKKLNENLELKIEERTKELLEKNSELKRMNKLFVDREQRMVELKQIIKDLKEKT